MTPGGPPAHALSPEGAGVSRRRSERVQVFSPTFGPATELGSDGLGSRLARFNSEVAVAIAELCGPPANEQGA